MRKLLLVFLCVCMTVAAHASTLEKYEFEYEDQGVTIIFEEDTVLSNDERQNIADCIVYGNPNEGISTYSLCWLTGHSIVTDSVIEIQHKVTADAPRCLRTVYEVETCSKCDYFKSTNLGSVFIPCCPED